MQMLYNHRHLRIHFFRQTGIFFQVQRVDNAGDMREKIDEYRVRNFELQNSVQTEDLLDKLDDFEREYEKFREDPLVEEFLDAELAFCRMMQEIDVKLAEAMDFE